MMRIKVPGGVMTAAQVREIGVAADAFAEGPDDSPVFGNRYADLTTRQDIQLHWIRIADVPRIWQRFWDVGLTTVQACGDSARNVCSCPVSGIDEKEVVDALPGGAGHLGVLHRQPRVRQPAAQVQDRRHRLHGGLRPGRDQRHRPVAGGAGRRHGRFQRAHRRWALRRRADGVRHRRLHPARSGGRALPWRGAALRRAGQPGEPRPGPHALPRPGARSRRVPRRTRRAHELRASSPPDGS